ncbi:MAG TPA: alkyl sulfatase dimerization domain-containing protein [Solirubrobacteraceae bacterium]|nr:alkyl sulfatase dimerization domain-containing protein [Solirubrobacteraceae bacterium]
MSDQPKDATEFTRRANQALLGKLPFDYTKDFEDAARGYIAPLKDDGRAAVSKSGRVVYDGGALDFVGDEDPAPDTVNPSLWRNAKLIKKGGLFKVVDRLYQVRGQDLSNLTIIEGDTGLILMDPLVSPETARAALELYFEHRPRKHVVAMIHSHSHVDHYGGVKGVIDEADVKAGRVRVIAPVGFLEAAVAENVLAGTAMSRRATYHTGVLLRPGPKGHVGVGLGIGASMGAATLIPPTEHITETGQKLEIDGLTFEFLLAPDTEAPAEMHWFVEELAALTAAENCCHTLHNTYTLRGAPTRDPQAWSQYLNDTIDRWGDRTEVLYGMHHWPVWGREDVLRMLRNGRDAYRYINDQTLRLANHGYTPVEIGEMIELPAELNRDWNLRGYYGTVNHNVKATYVKYLGWFDGNPAHLHTLPPEEGAKRYVELMGGAEKVLEEARRAFDEGEYRWVAEVVNHVIFADPSNKEARALQADTFEQMGYQAESGSWRGHFLTGAQELRVGTPDLPFPGTATPDSVRAMSLTLLFNYLAMRLNGPNAGDREITLNMVFSDTAEKAVLELRNGSLSHSLDRTAAKPDVTVTLERESLNSVIMGEADLLELAGNGTIGVEPDVSPLAELVGLLDTFELWFNIVEP